MEKEREREGELRSNAACKREWERKVALHHSFNEEDDDSGHGG